MSGEEKTNLVAQIEAFGLEHFRIVERPLAPLRHHEIRIRVHAASLNYRDLLIALGQVPRRVSDIRLPLVPLSDCSGEVIEVGSAVDRFQIGDRVASAQMPDWTAGPFNPRTGTRRSVAPSMGFWPDTSKGISVALSGFPMRCRSRRRRRSNI